MSVAGAAAQTLVHSGPEHCAVMGEGERGEGLQKAPKTRTQNAGGRGVKKVCLPGGPYILAQLNF